MSISEWKAIQDGDIRVFERMFKREYAVLFRHIHYLVQNKELAEELVQDVFIKVWIKREALSIDTNLGQYLRKVARHQALEYLRSQKPKDQLTPALHQHLTTVQPNAAERAHTEVLDRIHHSIASLPPRCRLIFQLCKQEGLTYTEVAEELGVSTESVKTQIKIAFRRIRADLKEAGWRIPDR